MVGIQDRDHIAAVRSRSGGEVQLRQLPRRHAVSGHRDRDQGAGAGIGTAQRHAVEGDLHRDVGVDVIGHRLRCRPGVVHLVGQQRFDVGDDGQGIYVGKGSGRLHGQRAQPHVRSSGWIAGKARQVVGFQHVAGAGAGVTLRREHADPVGSQVSCDGGGDVRNLRDVRGTAEGEDVRQGVKRAGHPGAPIAEHGILLGQGLGRAGGSGAGGGCRFCGPQLGSGDLGGRRPADDAIAIAQRDGAIDPVERFQVAADPQAAAQ